MRIIEPGVQSTLQGAPRRGWRHVGIPWAGPADPLSMALANRLVGNPSDAVALEISVGAFRAVFDSTMMFALAGAPRTAAIEGGINRATVAFHRTQRAAAGQTLTLGAPSIGVRTYLAVYGGFDAQAFLGSPSTYAPAGFGGHEGRALIAEDRLTAPVPPAAAPILETPRHFQPPIARAHGLRALVSAETAQLSPGSQEALFTASFRAGRRGDRMGLSLEGPRLELASDGRMKSAAVFPGAIQCPEDGAPIMLLVDAQTTGGYPRIAHIARCDRHLLGQIRPGDRVQLLKRERLTAVRDLRAKTAFWRAWLPGFTF